MSKLSSRENEIMSSKWWMWNLNSRCHGKLNSGRRETEETCDQLWYNVIQNINVNGKLDQIYIYTPLRWRKWKKIKAKRENYFSSFGSKRAKKTELKPKKKKKNHSSRFVFLSKSENLSINTCFFSFFSLKILETYVDSYSDNCECATTKLGRNIIINNI